MIDRIEFIDGSVSLYKGDSVSVVESLTENSIDAVATDPPYALTSIVKRFGNTSVDDDNDTGIRSKTGADGYARLARGFMGKEWDNGAVAFDPKFWAKVLRVMKPGAHLAAFGGTRTYHQLACAIESAGFEIRDAIMWHYGSGFPKSHDAGDGWGTALKPATEIICLARKPLSEPTVAANVLHWGTGAINIDATRVAIDASVDDPRLGGNGDWDTKYAARTVYAGGYEGKRIKSSDLGRWPANLVHDGSREVLSQFPDSDGQNGVVNGQTSDNEVYGKRSARPLAIPRGDAGSAARFFYSAKADDVDRLGSRHPTQKPVDLMSWIVRLICRKGGTVLDPFAGTGTTGEAAWREGMKAILIERESEYCDDIAKRLDHALSSRLSRKREHLKRRGKMESPGPLFS